MARFIHDVLKDLLSSSIDISSLTFILPNKRAGLFLKHELSQLVSKTLFAPETLSIEELVQELSQLNKINNTELLFEFYGIYLGVTPKDHHEAFDVFSKWSQMLLQDFNEIDRHLVEPNKVFNYLKAIKEIEGHHWSIDSHQTELTKNHLKFWESLPDYYYQLSSKLLENGQGYQGMLYREAVENLEAYIQNNPDKKLIFLGFNALNNAESTIIQELIQVGIAEIYWDVDSHFLKNIKHNVGHFIRKYKANWSYYKSNAFNWVANNYQERKNITIVGASKNVAQAKYIGELLATINKRQKSLANTAVVLGDETLLMPILNSIPKEIEKLNITMGFPLKSAPLASLFEQLFGIHNNSKAAYYYKEILAILTHQNVKPLFINNGADKIISNIKINNIASLTFYKMVKISPENEELLSLLFENWEDAPDIALSKCDQLIYRIKEFLDIDKSNNRLSLEYLFKFYSIFNTLNLLNTKYKYIPNIKVLHTLYRELMQNETLDFQGEPLEGLQIMGMLESRVLDFETLIISSVNEGILPSGKNQNSFIPFDVKLENSLPTYREKDAIYAYHFYRLIQHAKNIYLIYNTEADALNGGEKSRFISQLEIEGVHNITHYITSADIPDVTYKLKTIKKSESILNKIKNQAETGFSPSALLKYIRNPIDFYYKYILNINEHEDIEETVAAKTLGTVVHESLKEIYHPLINQYLKIDDLNKIKSTVDRIVKKYFLKIYKEGALTKGKNLIIFEIAKRYMTNFLDKEIESLLAGNTIKVLEVEVDLNTTVNLEGLDFPVKIKGQIDRIDEYNGVTRVIDYKTGFVKQSHVNIVEWPEIISDYEKYGKGFQVLMYTYILSKNRSGYKPSEAGIISFKNLNNGFLPFGIKESVQGKKRNTLITNHELDLFSLELKKLILEILNPKIDFIEKEV